MRPALRVALEVEATDRLRSRFDPSHPDGLALSRVALAAVPIAPGVFVLELSDRVIDHQPGVVRVAPDDVAEQVRLVDEDFLRCEGAVLVRAGRDQRRGLQRAGRGRGGSSTPSRQMFDPEQADVVFARAYI
jgi:hypothetical protein